LSYLGDVNIFNSDGKLINSSAAWPLPAISIADRAYFKAFKSSSRSTVLAEPVRSYYTGGWTAVIAYRLSGLNGVFLGVMGRRIDPANFENFFASVALGQGAAISLFHRDGTMLARYPHVDSMIGKNFKSSARLLNKVLTQGGRQTLRMQSPIDNQDRLGSAAELSHFPIVVVASTTVSAALADWHEQTRFLVATAALSALVIASILFLIVRQLNRQNQEAHQRLELQKHRLDTALNNMTQGLLLYDASARIVLCNQRYIDMFEVPAELVQPGRHYCDLVRYRKETGSFTGDVDEFCSTVLRNVAEGKVTHTVVQSAEGRSTLIVNQPLAHGGWVATLEDITERRNLEQERDRNYAFLRQAGRRGAIELRALTQIAEAQ
jgi:PAS domain-containing protein